MVINSTQTVVNDFKNIVLGEVLRCQVQKAIHACPGTSEGTRSSDFFPRLIVMLCFEDVSMNKFPQIF